MRYVGKLFLAVFILMSTFSCYRMHSANLPFWAEKAGNPARRFELAKRSEPELIAFVRRMPKGADLHVHVNGATYAEFALDIAEKCGLNYNVLTKKFTEDGEIQDKVISVEKLKKDPKCACYVAAFLNTASMRELYNTTNGHDHFFATFGYINPLDCIDPNSNPDIEEKKEDRLANVIAEIIRRKHYENLQYLELMATCLPSKLTDKLKKKLENYHDLENGKGGYFDPNYTEILEKAYKEIKPLIEDPNNERDIRVYLDKLDKKIMEALGRDCPVTGNEGDLVIRYISQLHRGRCKCMDNQNSKEYPRWECLKPFFVQSVASILAIKSEPRIVALNIVDPEDWTTSRENFEGQMAILHFLWNKMGKPKFSLHAGELVLRESPVDPSRNRISLTIEKGHALRIGHGVSIAWEDDVVGLLNKMRRESILVEICPSSNEAILGVKGKTHPFLLYRRAGVPVSINTDDEGVSRSNLTMEYVKAIRQYNLTYNEVKDLARNSLEYSFLPGKSLFIEKDYRRLLPEFKGIQSSNWHPDQKAKKLMNENPKLNRQVRLERAFIEFEEYLANGFTDKTAHP